MSGDKTKPRTRWGSGRVAVTAKWPEIAVALNAAWPLTMIYEKHMGESGISYSQFRRQVQRIQKTSSPALTTEPHETTEGQQRVSSVRKTFADHKGTADPALIRKLTSG